MILVIIISMFSVSLISKEVKAEENVCCEKTLGGESCVFTGRNNCDPSSVEPAATACEQTNYCKPGCCYNSESGVCARNTFKATCDEEGGTWKSSIDCNPQEVPQCQVGCCKLPNQCSLETQTRCSSFIVSGGDLRLEDVFDASITDEAACIQECRSEELGCCEATGEFGTLAECSDKPSFKSGVLCSNPELDTECTKEFETGCAKFPWQNQDAVYWYDSCGNPENIYGTGYNGFWISKENSCNPNDPNIENPACGNCDYTLGSKCSEADAAFLRRVDADKVQHMCIDLNCEETAFSDRVGWMDRRARKSGESWCEYEGEVGEGKDLVGSTHYLRYCLNGKEFFEQCEQSNKVAREGICIQGEFPANLVGSSGLTGALCKINNFQPCLDANSIDEQTTECGLSDSEYDNLDCGGGCELFDRDEQKNERLECCREQQCRQKSCEKEGNDCYWHEASSLCAPSVPPAIDAEDQCDIGVIGECKEVWVDEGWFGQWDPVKNENCHTGEYAQSMNEFCRSLGDCGVQYNIEGKLGDSRAGFTGPVIEAIEGHGPDRSDVDDIESWSIAESWNDLKKAENPLEESIAFIAYVSAFVFSRDIVRSTDESWVRNWKSYVIGALGAGSIFTATIISTATIYHKGYFFRPVIFKETVTAGYFTGLQNIWQGIKEIATLGKASGTFATGAGAILSTVGWGLTIFFLINKFFNKASVATVTYTFTCQPWVAPVGGDDCGKCDDFTVCDKYKCESLGQACKLENENTGNETCVRLNKNDAVPPVITPLPIEPRTLADFIYTPASLGNRGYEFKEEVPMYTTLQVGVKTNEKAQCRISKEDIPFDDMTTLFNDGLIKEEHKVEIPSFRGTAPNEDVFTNGGGTYLFYVKCRDINGNKNRESYFIKFNMEDEPDRVPPVIEEFSVPDNAFIPFGTRNLTLLSYLNEPIPVQGGCKYSLNDIPYDNMENNMTCSGNARISLNRYGCTATLNGLRDSVDNVFYFRCRDQNGNENEESQPRNGFHLKGTNELSITSKGPSGEIFSDAITLQLTTADGANGDGSAECSYSLEEFFDVNGLKFATTGSNNHEQTLRLESGAYNFKVWCQDIAGNRDAEEISFTLSVDNSGPRLKRILTDSQFLTLVMNEDGICEYSNTRRNFNFGEGTNMPTDNTKEHRATLQKGVYYVKCKDSFNNVGGFTIYT